MTDLTGHVALVTGGNSGIGLGMALGLARAGADVAIWGTNPTKNEVAALRLATTGRRVHAERCDVSDEDAVERSFAATVAALGRVDSVFVNAGTSGSVPAIWELTTAEWRRVMGINLDGAFFTARAAARHLVEQGDGGAIVFVASTSTIHGAPMQPHYAASKTALLGLTRALAVGLARYGIRVNALSPGWTDTDLLAPGKDNERFVQNTIGRTPVRRWADPDEFGTVAVYLADPALTFHTGDTVVVDGGYTIFSARPPLANSRSQQHTSVCPASRVAGRGCQRWCALRGVTGVDVGGVGEAERVPARPDRTRDGLEDEPDVVRVRQIELRDDPPDDVRRQGGHHRHPTRTRCPRQPGELVDLVAGGAAEPLGQVVVVGADAVDREVRAALRDAVGAVGP